jgi:divalent metal cation (Fe/Co/Zn/Cd) transporter
MNSNMSTTEWSTFFHILNFTNTTQLYDYYKPSTNRLSVVDYAAIVGLLLASALVGVYYSIFDRTAQSTTSGYLLADKALHPLPVAFSLMATFVSGGAMLSGPAEVYLQVCKICD